jgi:excisionase family DNA binding protein
MRKIPATKAAVTGATSESAHPTDFITVKEAAALLKLSEISIRRFLTQKKLRRFKVGARTLIRQTEAMSLIREAQ